MRVRLRSVRAVARSEALHLRRNPRTLMLAFIQPVMLLILYGYCITFDLHRVPFAVWDQDRTGVARQLVQRLAAGQGGETFTLLSPVRAGGDVDRLLARGDARFVLVIPRGFASDLAAGKSADVQALFDAADANAAGVTAGYLEEAVRRIPLGRSTGAVLVDCRWRALYNPDLSSRRFIVPGLLAILLSFLAATLTSTSITRERELSSLEMLLTSPVTAVELVIGKLLPYVALSFANIVLVLLIGGVLFGVWPRGDLLTLSTFSLLFLLAMLAVGMLVSAVAPTQQLGLMFAVMLTMLPNIFLSGFAWPRGNMPDPLQAATELLPGTQYLVAIRGIFLKGAGWASLWPQGLVLGLTVAGLLALTVWVVHAGMERGLE